MNTIRQQQLNESGMARWAIDNLPWDAIWEHIKGMRLPEPWWEGDGNWYPGAPDQTYGTGETTADEGISEMKKKMNTNDWNTLVESASRMVLNEQEPIPISLRADQEQLVGKDIIGVPVPKQDRLRWTGTVPIVTIITAIIVVIWEILKKLNPWGIPGWGGW